MITICYVVQYFVDKGFRNYNVEEYEVWNKILAGEINADIIINGSSRARHQFDPKILEEKTSFSCFDIGVDGGKLITIKSRWDSYLAHNKPPKILIQNFDMMYFNSEGVIMNKEKYLPYLSEPPVFSNLERIDKKILFEKNIPLYKYRGFPSQILVGLKSYFIPSSIDNPGEYHGAKLFDKKWAKQSFVRFKANNKTIFYPKERLTSGFQYLKELSKECIANGIKLILVYTPMYFGVQNLILQRDSVDAAIKKFAQTNEFLFWDYSQDSLSYNTKYFFDSLHLNKLGAEIFTKHLASDLKKFIDDKKLSFHSHS